jgi:hypothetical protein
MSADLVLNDELKNSINAAVNSTDIREIVIAEAQRQGLTPEAAAQQVAADAAKTAADAAAAVVSEPTVYTRTEIIGGQSFTFDAGSELELERAVNNAYKVAYSLQTQEPAAIVEHVPDAAQLAAEKAAAEQLVAAKAELELQFKRGDINARQYLEQSGAIGEYLAEQGVPLNELKNAVQEQRGRGFEQSWADATQDFLNSPAGHDWPGGERNKEILGMTIAGLGLVDAEDKLAAMSQAYASMKAANTVFPHEEEAAPVVAAAAVAAPVVAAVVAAPITVASPAKTAPTSSSMFGSSSGVSAPSGGTAAAAAVGAKLDIPADATPQQILAYYKESLIANHQDPNAAFIEQHATKR